MKIGNEDICIRDVVHMKSILLLVCHCRVKLTQEQVGPAPSDSDKGQVSCYSIVPHSLIPDRTDFSSTCLAIHIILNLVVGIILVAYIPSQINKKNISSATSSLFWSSAIVGAPFTLIFIAARIGLTNSAVAPRIIGLNEVYASIIFLLLLFLPIVELMVAIF